MSTKIAPFSADLHDRLVLEGLFEQAVYSAFNNLICERRSEGLTKAAVAERMGTDRGTITKLTSGPTNMKICTAAALADALDADPMFLLVDRLKGRMFSSIGTHVSQSALQNVASQAPISAAPVATSTVAVIPSSKR